MAFNCFEKVPAVIYEFIPAFGGKGQQDKDLPWKDDQDGHKK